MHGDWWTWSGSNRRPLSCHGTTKIVSDCRCSTYEPVESAKEAKIAVSCYQTATKSLVGKGADRGGSALFCVPEVSDAPAPPLPVCFAPQEGQQTRTSASNFGFRRNDGHRVPRIGLFLSLAVGL